MVFAVCEVREVSDIKIFLNPRISQMVTARPRGYVESKASDNKLRKNQGLSLIPSGVLGA